MKKFVRITLNEREARTLYVVLDELLARKDLNEWLGSLTIEEAKFLRHKIQYADYCKRHHIRHTSMTEEDYENYYYEELDRKVAESYEIEE
jgi:lantibiotic modifying enzyme